MNARELSNLAVLEGTRLSPGQAAADLESMCLLSALLVEHKYLLAAD